MHASRWISSLGGGDGGCWSRGCKRQQQRQQQRQQHIQDSLSYALVWNRDSVRGVRVYCTHYAPEEIGAYRANLGDLETLSWSSSLINDPCVDDAVISPFFLSLSCLFSLSLRRPTFGSREPLISFLSPVSLRDQVGPPRTREMAGRSEEPRGYPVSWSRREQKRMRGGEGECMATAVN